MTIFVLVVHCPEMPEMTLFTRKRMDVGDEGKGESWGKKRNKSRRKARSKMGMRKQQKEEKGIWGKWGLLSLIVDWTSGYGEGGWLGE